MALILLVDDSNDDLNVMKEFLDEQGHSHKIATSGQEAFDLIQKQKFDLVMSDYHMENGDGLWLLQKLKTLIHPPRCILITGEFRYGPDYYFSLGAAGFCFKPIIWDKLKAEIDRLI